MNFKAKSAVFTSAIALSMMLAACGSDDNSSNVEREEGSSSSVEETSSSSVEESSSSVKSDLPKGTRAATLDDLEKNLSLGEMFGTELFFAAGAKQGVFSLWILDDESNQEVGWIVVHSDFKDGVIEIGMKNGSYMGAETENANKMQEFFEKSGKLEFVVKDEKTLQVSINGGDYKDVEKAKVPVSSTTISDGTQLQGVKLTCKTDDGQQVYSFYKGRYLVEETVDKKTVWSAGYYDIERSHLLMLPVFYNEDVYSMVSASVSSDYEMIFDAGDSQKCEKTKLDYKDVDREALVGEWVAPEDGLDWTLTFKKSGDYSVEAKKGREPAELKSGIWDIYGNMLFLKNTTCKNRDDGTKCTTAVKGSIEGFDAEKGFTFNHDDPDSPAVPKTWTLPQYE